MRPGDRVVTPGGLATVCRLDSPFGAEFIEVQRDCEPAMRDHYLRTDLRPVKYPQQFAPQWHRHCVAFFVMTEPNPYLEAQK